MHWFYWIAGGLAALAIILGLIKLVGAAPMNDG